MVKSVYVPEAGGILDFADDVTPQEMSGYINAKYPRGAGGVAAIAPQSDNSGILDNAAYTFGTMFTDVPGGIASLMYPASKEDETWGGQFSKYWRERGAKNNNIDLTKERTTAQNVGSVIGSVVGFAVPGGLAAKGAGLAGAGVKLASGIGTATVAGQGIAVGAEQRSEQLRQQMASGMNISEEQQLSAQRLSGLIGASDALPMQKFFGPIGTLLSKVPASKAPIVEKIIQNRLTKITKAGLEEAAQEVASGIANDLMEYGVYNPDVQIGQDLFTNAAGGGFAGSALEGVIQLAAGRKLRGSRQLATDLAKEKQENSAAQRQVEIADAAERLRQTGVEGKLTIEPNEDPDGRQRFTVMSPKGQPLIDLYGSQEDAAQAVNMYKQNTGANVSVDIKEIPKLDPVRIGNRRFPTIEAAMAKRDEIRKHIMTLERYGNDIEAISKEAALRKMQPGVLFKQVEDSLKTHRTNLAMFDRYFSSTPGPETVPGPTVKPADAAVPGPKTEDVTEGIPAEATAPEPAPVEEPSPEFTEEDFTSEIPAEQTASPDEPITSEEDVPEMPIGAVEMPVEESRVLPDEIIDSATGPIPASEPVDVKVEKRPAATVEDLAGLQTELFGKPTNIREMTDEQRAIYEAERDKRFPPQDVDTYYAAGQINEAIPKNIREAAIHGPVVKDYTPATEKWMKNVYTDLQSRLDTIVPEGAKLELKAMIDGPSGYLIRGLETPVNTQYGIKSVVDLATGVLKPGMSVNDAVKELSKTLNHEIIHVLRTKGVLRPAEWKMLARAASTTNMPGKKYTYLDKVEAVYTKIGPDGLPMPMSEQYADPETLVEEAVADMYRDWVTSQSAPPPVRGLLNRITEFFRRIFQTLRNAQHEDVFKKIESGEVGSRTDGVPKQNGERFSSGQTEEFSGGINEDGTLRVQPYPDLNTGSSTAYLRKNFKRFTAKGRRKDEEWGAALDRAFIDRTGRTFDITIAGDYDHIVASVADEVKHQMKQAQSGVGWYDDDIKLVFEELSKSFPILKDPSDGPAYRQMFTMIAGVMSNGMKAKANVELASINFAHFLNTGKFSAVHPFTKTGWNQRSNIMGPQIDMLNSMISDKQFAPRPGSNNPKLERLEKFLKFMFTEHSIREINQFRSAHGTKSPAKIGKLDERRLGMYAFGPKFGPFILNLNGLSDETVDSWASRSFYRHMGRGIGPDGELVKAPLTGVEREAMKRALRDVAAATNLSSRDIQAVLWFYEKELYNHFGQSIPLEVFSDGSKEFTRKYGTGSSGPQQSGSSREGAIARSIKAAGARTSQTVPGGSRFSAAPTVDSDEFKLWFDGSYGTESGFPDGAAPKVFYTGTSKDTIFDSFKAGQRGIWFTSSPAEASQYAVENDSMGSRPKRGTWEFEAYNTASRVIPVYLSYKNPYTPTSEELDRLYESENYAKAQRDVFNSIRAKNPNIDAILLTDSFSGDLAVVVFDPKQVKSIFNKFKEGAARSARFSAAPLPAYVEQQNETLFVKTPKVPFRNMIFDWAFGHHPEGKVIRVNGRDVNISQATMTGVAGKAAAVDNAAFLTELEKTVNLETTGNYQRMQADYSATAAIAWLRRSSHVMASMLLRGNLGLHYDRPGDIMSATMKVQDDPDNLKEVFKVMTEPAYGDKTKADIFKTYAVARRGEWLRATGQTVPRELTPQYISEAIASVQRDYPEVVEAYNMYQRFNKKLMTTVRDAGLISTAELGRLTNQMNYYGFIYEMYGEALGPNSPQKAASQFKLRPYTGSQHGGLVNDPMFVMIQNAQFMVTSVAKNLAATKSLKLAESVGEARLLQTNETPNEFQGEQPDVMFMSENGVVKRYAVNDPLMVTALGSDDRINVGRFWETLGIPAQVLRESVTRDPGFMARNLLRDTLSSWITSGVNFTPVVDTLKNFGIALKGGGSFNDLSARGVVGSYDLALQTPADLAKNFRRSLPKNVIGVTSVEGLSAGVRSLWNRLGHVSEASDAATRMAVYDALIKDGATEAEAAMQAIELLDFTRRGGSQTLGILTKLIPFLNARIQGMDVLYQAGRSGFRVGLGRSLGERDSRVGKSILIKGAFLAAIAVGLEWLNQDDDDYKQLDDYIKNGNFIIPLKEFGLPGQFMAIPKPFEAGLLFATIPQQIYKTTQGDASTRENASLFWGQLAGTFGVNPIPQALLPPIEMITNHNFYTGLPLISEGKARLAPELQYNSSTSQLAMMIGGLPIFYDFNTGRFGGASPIMIDKLISGYGGPVGSYMAMGVGLAMENYKIGPERMPVELSNAPVVRSFFIDAKTKNPKVVTQAYELFRIADEANRTVSRFKQMHDAEGLMQYVNENRDILTYKKYIFKLADRLNKLSAEERAIERSENMTREEKFAAQEKLREVRIRLASQVDMINKKLGR